MTLSGFFTFLGVEKSAPDAARSWTRVGLVQGLESRIFYLSDDSLASKIEKLGLKASQQVEATISIKDSKGRTYFSLEDIETT